MSAINRERRPQQIVRDGIQGQRQRHALGVMCVVQRHPDGFIVQAALINVNLASVVNQHRLKITQTQRSVLIPQMNQLCVGLQEIAVDFNRIGCGATAAIGSPVEWEG